jgi:pSer/pThr/pTyr-binding forkhead associated (FHA) protein
MRSLIIQTGKNKGQKLVLPETEVTIGRDPDCSIRLSSADVSRRHCALRVAPEGIYVRDLGSQNGTLVNEVPIAEERLLEPGDMLRIGPMQFLAPREAATVKPAASEAADPPAPGKAATDDDIANWLSDDSSEFVTVGPGDTTIIPGKPPTKGAKSHTAGEGDPPALERGKPAAKPVPSKPPSSTEVPTTAQADDASQSAPARKSPKGNKPLTVAEEAADIIRRHQELLRQEEQDEQSRGA